MDNFSIDVTSNNDKALLSALEIVFQNNSKAVGYKIKCKHGLVFYWHDDVKDLIRLPHKTGPADVLPVIKGWLAEQDYGEEPDHDGSNGKGWRLYNEAWGHVDGESAAFFAVKPEWAMYGK